MLAGFIVNRPHPHAGVGSISYVWSIKVRTVRCRSSVPFCTEVHVHAGPKQKGRCGGHTVLSYDIVTSTLSRELQCQNFSYSVRKQSKTHAHTQIWNKCLQPTTPFNRRRSTQETVPIKNGVKRSKAASSMLNNNLASKKLPKKVYFHLAYSHRQMFDQLNTNFFHNLGCTTYKSLHAIQKKAK